MDKKFIERKELESLIDKRDKAVENNRAVTKMRKDLNKSGKKFFENMNARHDLYMDIFTNGQMIKYKHGTVVKYGQITLMENIYRGEHMDFEGSTTSTLGRDVRDLSREESIILLLIQQLRINRFCEMLKSSHVVDEWNFGNIFVYIIAQHYGLRTQYLDLTDDVTVALFFACTKNVNNKFSPLKDEDFKEYGNDGVLYRYVSFNLHTQNIKPIGYQPFTRCFRQRGYFVDTYDFGDIRCFDLIKTLQFEKLYFKRDEEFCKKIFDKFKGGDLLFPKEEHQLIEIVENLKSINEFSKDEYTNALNALKVEDRKYISIDILQDFDIKIVDNLQVSTDILIGQINKLDLKQFIEREEFYPGFRRVVSK